MKRLKSVYDDDLKKYGQALEDHSFTCLLERLRTQQPADGVKYVASCEELEKASEKLFLTDNVFGGIPVQVGFCSGSKTFLTTSNIINSAKSQLPPPLFSL